MSTQGRAMPLSLVGVVVHEGASLDVGHYTAFVKDKSGEWYSKNDGEVCCILPLPPLSDVLYVHLHCVVPARLCCQTRRATLEEVLGCTAYMVGQQTPLPPPPPP
jgi:hypothetical protein